MPGELGVNIRDIKGLGFSVLLGYRRGNVRVHKCVYIYIYMQPPPQRSTVFRVKANFNRNLLGN